MVAQDVIGHLIDVERLAYDLLLDAQTEADRRKAAAKEKADAEFKAAYEQIISRLEEELKREKKACDDRLSSEYSRFDSELTSIPKDYLSMAAYLESVTAGL
ncbi:MAG TPA: hypothetical protein PL077_05030 [Treponemataceae bacterium]|nr:hypothetical protein [Treponemataceae bacterium]